MANRAGECRIDFVMSAEPKNPTALVKQLAHRMGFDLVGVTSAEDLPESARRLAQAVEKGCTAGMNYLQRDPARRASPMAFKPWAKSIISVGINYNAVPLCPTSVARRGLISRYALGRDYHLLLKEKLRKFAAELTITLGRTFRSFPAVDTSPLMEKPLAVRAGIGWQGKNSLIINEQFGSWIFLGELITDLDLTADAPSVSRCGSCRACIDACPAGALSERGPLDARKCLSFLTVEHKGEFSPAVVEMIQSCKGTSGYLFGCDICQEVCPFNQDTPPAREKQFQPRDELLNVTVEQAEGMSKSEFKKLTCETAMERLSFQQFQRNVRAVK